MRYIITILAVVLLAGCATTNFMAYQGASVQQGTGGAFVNVDGIDIWQEGTPPRKFQVIGVITDSRAAGPIAMAGRNKGIARMAKRYGGNAVLLAADLREFAGMLSTSNATTNINASAYRYGNTAYAYGTANTFAMGTTAPMYRANSKYYIIRYL
jgi:hypothetical protein